MSKVKLLLDVIEDVRSLADSLQAVADVMLSDDVVIETPRKPTTKKETKSTVVTEPQKKALSLEEVRAVLAEKSRKGHTATVKELLIKHGANKLSDIDPNNYEALLADVEVL